MIWWTVLRGWWHFRQERRRILAGPHHVEHVLVWSPDKPMALPPIKALVAVPGTKKKAKKRRRRVRRQPGTVEQFKRTGTR